MSARVGSAPTRLPTQRSNANSTAAATVKIKKSLASITAPHRGGGFNLRRSGFGATRSTLHALPILQKLRQARVGQRVIEHLVEHRKRNGRDIRTQQRGVSDVAWVAYRSNQYLGF